MQQARPLQGPPTPRPTHGVPVQSDHSERSTAQPAARFTTGWGQQLNQPAPALDSTAWQGRGWWE